MSIAQPSALDQHPSDSRPSKLNAMKYVLMIILQRPYPSHFDHFSGECDVFPRAFTSTARVDRFSSNAFDIRTTPDKNNIP